MDLPRHSAPLSLSQNGSAISSPRSPSQAGVTLLELLIVLVILIAMAGVAITTSNSSIPTELKIRGADGESREAGEIITLETMRAVRDALVGTSTADPGYRGDLANLPSRLSGLFENIDGELPFDPATKRGWNGPYLHYEGARYGDFLETGDRFPTTPPARLTEPAILDSWRKPLLLQQHDTRSARLVSAGPDRVLDTDATNPVDADRGDDLVFFLLSADPNL